MRLGLYGIALNLEFIAIGVYLVVRIIGLGITFLGTRRGTVVADCSHPNQPLEGSLRR